jgi:6-phosphogluconolactonase
MRSITVVYVANADSRDIDVLELNESNGRLTIIEKVPVAGHVMPLAISPNRTFLYASLRSEPHSLSSFAINPANGKLTLRATVPLPGNMAYISTDRTGCFLFGASYDDNKISINVITATGDVVPCPLAVIRTGKNAHAIATDTSNKFLFVSNLGDDVILQYRFDEQSGQVTPNDPPAVEIRKGSGPRHFVFHPNARFVFGTNELDGSVSTYRFNASGTLRLLDSSSVMPSGFNGKPWTADIHLTPDGRFLYASERASNTIAAFRIDDNIGKLIPIGNYPTETQPRGFNIDPEGKYLLAAGQISNALSTYAINQEGGALHKLSRRDGGRNPNWIEIVKLSRNLSQQDL